MRNITKIELMSWLLVMSEKEEQESKLMLVFEVVDSIAKWKKRRESGERK